MIHIKEAFIYLWYDAYNKMYYLGKHKGTPDDSYTHSSTIWESFTKDTIPEGVTRRILAYGTDEEMCILENKLLVNRKERCWDRYYNESLGDPRYVDTSGKNNPMWGKTHTPEAIKKMSDVKKGKKLSEEHKKNLSEAKSDKNNPSYKDGKWVGARNNPKIRAAVDKVKYANMTPEEKEKLLRELKEKRANMTPEDRKALDKKYNAKKRAKKKALLQGVGTLEPLLT